MANQVFPNWTGSGGGSSSVEVNGAGVPGVPNFNQVTPPAPDFSINTSWRADGSGNISSALTPGNVSIAVAGVPVSDDYDFSVNGTDQSVLVNSTLVQNTKPVFVNGV